jgi:hypothetical protein
MERLNFNLKGVGSVGNKEIKNTKLLLDKISALKDIIETIFRININSHNKMATELNAVDTHSHFISIDITSLLLTKFKNGGFIDIDNIGGYAHPERNKLIIVDDFFINNNKNLIIENETLKSELKQLRRSQMQPAVKFLGNSIGKQLCHMQSELGETVNEFVGIDIDIKKAAMEIIDLQFSCQTMLEGTLGLSKDQIADYIQMVVKKNADRGYDKK